MFGNKIKDESFTAVEEFRRSVVDQNQTADFVKNLNLPQYDPNENPQVLKDELLNQQSNDEFEKQRKAAEEKRRQIKEKFENILQ